jgi:hypothetical protein
MLGIHGGLPVAPVSGECPRDLAEQRFDPADGGGEEAGIGRVAGC